MPAEELDHRPPALMKGQRDANGTASQKITRPSIEIPRFNEIKARQLERVTPCPQKASFRTLTSRRAGGFLGVGLPGKTEQW